MDHQELSAPRRGGMVSALAAPLFCRFGSFVIVGQSVNTLFPWLLCMISEAD